jgi:Fic family protein
LTDVNLNDIILTISLKSMNIIGQYQTQKDGYKAFIPAPFPPDNIAYTDVRLVNALSKADITKLLPDIDFFIYMYVKKEATYSSQIEGTRANLTDALTAEVEKTPDLPDDVDDILHYIDAMHKGFELSETIPLSVRLIREVHKVLLTGGRSTAFAYPGEFRTTGNWINGTGFFDAEFVPPPPEHVMPAIGDIENFIHKKDDLPVLIKAGLIHAQFETIHPFTDGNGRTGRLLITFYLCKQKILEKQVLYLSAYFKKYRDIYFAKLQAYHNGHIAEWLEFFLHGIEEIAQEAIRTTDAIVSLRERDIQRVSGLGKSTKHGIALLQKLYTLPIMNIRKVEEVTGLSRVSSNRLVRKFMELGILVPKDKRIKYGRLFIYKDYFKLFE